MNLATQVERWNKFWITAAHHSELERPLERLRWLEEFTFHCGPEITRQDFQALQEQLEKGNTRLAELQGDFESKLSVAKTPFPAGSQVTETKWRRKAVSGVAERSVFATPRENA